MIAIIWLVALVLAIPTYGISVIVVVVIHSYLNWQNKIETQQMTNMGIAMFSRETIAKHGHIMRENQMISSWSDVDIVNEVVKTMATLELYMEEMGRFENDKTLVQEVAIRFVSIREAFEDEPSYIEAVIRTELNEISMYGLDYVRNKKYPNL